MDAKLFGKIDLWQGYRSIQLLAGPDNLKTNKMTIHSKGAPTEKLYE
jgi:hypothetical protein